MELATADLCLGREHANFGHQIVVNLALDCEGRLDIYFGRVRFEIGDFFRRYEAFLGLSLGKRNPDRPPQNTALFFREQRT